MSGLYLPYEEKFGIVARRSSAMVYSRQCLLSLSRPGRSKVSVLRLGENFESRSRPRSNSISVSKQKLRLETSFIGTAL